MMSKYSPIDCNYYDRLEAWATLRKDCDIVWINNDRLKHQVKSKILSLEIRNGAEYLIGEQGLQIRLDQLISVNGIPLEGHSCNR
jgi:Rho-binding antiterminator